MFKLSLNLLSHICIVLMFTLSSNWTHAYQMLDKAIALVEDKVILQSELDQRLTHLSIKQPDFKITNTIKKQVLDQLIFEQLQLNMAEKIKLEIGTSDIDDTINALKQRLTKEGTSFKDYLATQQLNEEQLTQSKTI
jgi:peptidyl-prolyl cis-trans isomerase SurA